MADRYPNKRQRFRKGGRFAKPPSLEESLTFGGMEMAHGPRVCNHCSRKWAPIVVTGRCPNCGAQDSRPAE